MNGMTDKAIHEIKHGRPSKDEYYLNIALAVAARGTCLRRKYGCIIIKDDIIVATGYNGNPRGETNCTDLYECKRAECKRYEGYDKCHAVHAEQNALIAATKENLKDATLYLACLEYNEIWTTDGVLYDASWKEDNNPKPCNMCTNMIWNAGIKNIITRGNEYEFVGRHKKRSEEEQINWFS